MVEIWDGCLCDYNGSEQIERIGRNAGVFVGVAVCQENDLSVKSGLACIQSSMFVSTSADRVDSEPSGCMFRTNAHAFTNAFQDCVKRFNRSWNAGHGSLEPRKRANELLHVKANCCWMHVANPINSVRVTTKSRPSSIAFSPAQQSAIKFALRGV